MYVAMDLIPILLGSLPLAHNAQHSLVIGRAGASPPSRTAAIIFLYIYLYIYPCRTSCPKSSTCFFFSDISIFLRRKCYTRFFFSDISIFPNLYAMRHGFVSHGFVRLGFVGHGFVGHGFIGHGFVGHGFVRHGIVQHGFVRHGMSRS